MYLKGAVVAVFWLTYLYYYERHSFSTAYIIYRYVDDLICIIIDNSSPINIDFYPSNLELIPNEPSVSQTVNYLDLNLKTLHNRVITNLYDKKDSYNFTIIKLLSYRSCNSIQLFRNIILNQLFRIHRLSDPQFHYLHIDNLKRISQNYHYPNIFVNNIISNFKYTT